MKIDCRFTENYLKEAQRQSLALGYTGHSKKYLETAISEVQQWSDDHPQKTYLEDLLEKYPNYMLNEKNIPVGCFKSFGYETKKCPKDCSICWNQIMEERNE
ncbi:MAG: hypothetical protein JJE18_01555 [Eubacteriaceae bacterium]|nr:hypothetical protein [Eubacteriaceae bacterium]